MMKNFFILIVCLVTITGCAANRVKYVDRHDPIMDRNGGVVVLVDVALRVDVIGDNDYVVVKESKAGAEALGKEIKLYLEKHGVLVRSVMTPFVGGAIRSADNPPVKFAEKRGGSVSEAVPPFGISDDIKDDPEYVSALSNLSTYVYQNAVAAMREANAKKNKKKASEAVVRIVDEKTFENAVKIIEAKTGASSILYFGVKGACLSRGKSFGQGLFKFTVGTATAVATAGMGTGYYVAVMPGGDTNSRFITSGLANLEAGETIWKTWGMAGGNPLKTKIIADPRSIESILRNLVSEKVEAKPSDGK